MANESPEQGTIRYVRCPTCGAPNPGTADVCARCGNPMQPAWGPASAQKATTQPIAQVICSNCGKALPPKSKFCGYCGTALPEPPAVVAEQPAAPPAAAAPRPVVPPPAPAPPVGAPRPAMAPPSPRPGQARPPHRPRLHELLFLPGPRHRRLQESRPPAARLSSPACTCPRLRPVLRK